MAQTGTMRFDPARIAETAGDLRYQCDVFTKSLGAIRQQANGLKGSWRSDGHADAFYETAGRLNEKGEGLARMLETFSVSLYQAAGVYTQGERDAKGAAERLPTEIVFRV